MSSKFGRLDTSAVATNGIKVVVRLRPLVDRASTNTNNVDLFVQMVGNETILLPKNHHSSLNPSGMSEARHFSVDHSLWSFDRDHPNFADQEEVYTCCGEEFLNHTLEGYNTCLFAYGQTGSGKSYTMFGETNDGLIPRISENLFAAVNNSKRDNTSFSISINYFEIYNEEVFDLLDSKTVTKKKMRENEQGPYVENLNEIEIKTTSELFRYLNEGTLKRKTAATKSNSNSSRSHAVFTIKLVQKEYMSDELVKEKTSHLRLVDLAGSERANNTGNTGLRLKEGSNINKSLTTLGRVLTILSEKSGKPSKQVVPYRDSALTWLLKESIGGNSRSCMICCISPTDYEETYSSLRYATMTKKIQNKAVVNNTSKKSQDMEELERIQDAEKAKLNEIIDDLKFQLNENENKDLVKIKNLIKFNNDIQNERFFKLSLKLSDKEKALKYLQTRMAEYYNLIVTGYNYTYEVLDTLYKNDWKSFHQELHKFGKQINDEVDFFKAMA